MHRDEAQNPGASAQEQNPNVPGSEAANPRGSEGLGPDAFDSEAAASAPTPAALAAAEAAAAARAIVDFWAPPTKAWSPLPLRPQAPRSDASKTLKDAAAFASAAAVADVAAAAAGEPAADDAESAAPHAAPEDSAANEDGSSWVLGIASQAVPGGEQYPPGGSYDPDMLQEERPPDDEWDLDPLL